MSVRLDIVKDPLAKNHPFGSFFMTERMSTVVAMSAMLPRVGTRKKPYAGGLNGAVASVLRGEKAMAGISNHALADRSGVPYESVRRYLAAERAIDVDILDKLSGVFGLTAAEVMRRGQLRLLETAEAEPEPTRATVSDAEKVDEGVYRAVRGNSSLRKALDRKPSGDTPPSTKSQRDDKKSVNRRRKQA